MCDAFSVLKSANFARELAIPEPLNPRESPSQEVTNRLKAKLTPVDLNNVVLELVSCGLQGILTASQVVTLLKAVDEWGKEQQITEQVAYCIIDVLWLAGTQCGPSGNEQAPSNAWKTLVEIVRDIYRVQLVDINMMKVSLELNLLVSAGIAKDEANILTKLKKLNTALVYRQQKYNLLNEETEGYSKLIVALSNLPPAPVDISAHIGNVLSLVGTFDLDPNRVLDISLDIFEKNLWNYESFLKLLKQFRKNNIVHIMGFKFAYYHKSVAVVDDDASTNVPPPTGAASAPVTGVPATAAAITANTETISHKPAPESLYRVAAILIVCDFMKLGDLLPYLQPIPADTKKLQEEQEKLLVERIKDFGMISLNAPTAEKPASAGSSSGPAISSSASSQALNQGRDYNGKSTVVVNEPVPYYESAAIAEPEYADGNQLIGLAAAFLSLNCWDHCQQMLQYLESYSVDIMKVQDAKVAMIGFISYIINDLYLPISHLHSNLAKVSKIEEVQSIQIPRQHPKFASLSTLPTDLLPFLRKIGIELGSSPRLFTKICRLLRAHLLLQQGNRMDVDENSVTIDIDARRAELDPVKVILGDIMLPSLSISDSNAFIAEQLWQVISLFPFQVRFELYNTWVGGGLGKEGVGTKSIKVCMVEAKCLQTAKGSLKRVSMENTRIMGRQLGRETNVCPIIVYTYVLTQIESYDNLIPFIAESLKYGTFLAKDCMAYCMLIQLHKDGEKLKKGDTHHSRWFGSLSKFIGTFYRKYPATELKGLLHFLMQQLSKGETADLLVLKELLGKMGGCDTLTEVSDVQLEGLCGGRALKAETMINSTEAASKRAVLLLREELMTSGTALPILLFIAKLRSKVLFCTDSKHLKFISYLYDTCQDVLMQFTEFLVAGCKTIESVAVMMPSIKSMIDEIGLTLPVVFQLIRPIVRAALQYSADPKDPTVPSYLLNWHPFSDVMISTINSYVPSGVLANISPNLFVVFWSLSVYDIYTPSARYETEKKRLQERYTELEKQKNAPISSEVTQSERMKNEKMRKNEMSRIIASMKDLTEEYNSQRKHVEQVRLLIAAQNQSYFKQHQEDEERLVNTDALLQYCVHDRMLMSPLDAVYCSKFYLALHELNTPRFCTVSYVDKVTRTILPLLFCSTESEAAYIGYSLVCLLQVLSKWYSDKAVYDTEAAAVIGFATKHDYGSINDDGVEKITHDQFKEKFASWHQQVQRVVLSALSSKEYIHIRSALIFLSRVSKQYPITSLDDKKIHLRIEQIESEEADRVDLQLMAKSINTLFKQKYGIGIKREVDTSKVDLKKVVDNTSSAKDKKPVDKVLAASKDKDVRIQPAPNQNSKTHGASAAANSSQMPRGGEKRPRDDYNRDNRDRGPPHLAQGHDGRDRDNRDRGPPHSTQMHDNRDRGPPHAAQGHDGRDRGKEGPRGRDEYRDRDNRDNRDRGPPHAAQGHDGRDRDNRDTRDRGPPHAAQGHDGRDRGPPHAAQGHGTSNNNAELARSGNGRDRGLPHAAQGHDGRDRGPPHAAQGHDARDRGKEGPRGRDEYRDRDNRDIRDRGPPQSVQGHDGRDRSDIRGKPDLRNEVSKRPRK